jgi:hypothetical protein
MIKTLKAFGLWLLQGILGVVLGFAFAFVLVEWASGCGETYVDSKGKTHINECVLFSKP